MSYEVIDLYSPNIRIVKNFLTKDEVDKILEVKNFSEDLWRLDYIQNYPKIEDVAENLRWAVAQWDGMCINVTHDDWYKRYNLDQSYYLNLSERIKFHIEERFNVSTLRKEQYLINRWRPGREQTPHLDYFYEEEANHDYEMLSMNNIPKEFLDTFGKMFQTKHLSSLIYLNDDYEGGELWFPQYDNYSIKPEVGTLILFRGDENTLHGVKKVESGIRYTISLFWEDTEYKNKIVKA
jgi:hypothetical protein